jgi:VCBS repeat-containing protein
MTLLAGDIAFTGFNADGTDNLAFVALAPIASGTVIYFSGNEWNGTGWVDFNEDAFSLTLSSAIAAGSIVQLNGVGAAGATSPQGTIAAVAGGGTNLGVGNSGEMIYVYLADAATPLVPTTFLTAVSNNGATSGSLTGTGLTYGVNALNLATVDADADVAAFNGSRSSESSFAAYGAILNNAANWLTQDGSGDQFADGIAPDLPFDATAFSLSAPGQAVAFAANSLALSRAEGDAGSRTLTFTVTRTGGTTGDLAFTGTFDAGATNAADFGGTLPTFAGTILANAASAQVVITITGDLDIEANEAFSLTLTGGTNSGGVAVTVGANGTATGTILTDDATLSVGGINVYEAGPSLAGSTTTPTATNDLVLVRLGSIQGTVAGAESIAYENGKVYSTNIAGNAINVHSVTAAGTLVNETAISLSGLPSYLTGGVNSVDIKNGVIAVGYENANTSLAGFVALFNAADNTLIKTIQVGILPDDVTFTPDGMKLLVANEGEALSANGTISIIDLSGGAAAAFVSNTIAFDSLNGAETVLRDRGVQVIPGQSAAGDIEPEYITVSADGTRAYVTLQEVNSVAVIDLTNPTADRPIAIQALGTVDFSLPGNAIDPSDQDGAGGTASINIRNVPVQGLIQPDAIASFDVAGVTYFVTANEGDSRVNVTDLARLSSAGIVLDPTAFPNAAALKAAANLGRLNVSNNVGDTDGDGDIDVIHTIGGRGISIFRQNVDGTITKVRETGGEFEAITAALVPGSFNSNQSVTGFDSRSDDKGPEPEGVTIGVVDGRTYAFVGLERVGGYMVYDVTDPANASFVSYKAQTGADLGPETSAFVSAASSPTGQALLLSGQEISNTVTLYSIQTQSEGNDTINGGSDGESWNGRGGNDTINGNGGNDSLTGGSGDDAIDGGEGTDTAVFTGSWLGFDVTNGGGTVDDINAANGDEGTDTLTTVEQVSFNGVAVAASAAVNDAPIGVNDTNAGDALVEDGDATAVGNVLTNDADADLALGLGETIAVTGVRTGNEAAVGGFTAIAGATVITGTYGDLTINADGSWSYALVSSRAATNALTNGQIATETFTYRVADGHGLTDTAELALSIQGTADTYRLQLLHLSDGEAGTLAPSTAPFLAALADRFEDQYANSITLAGGDTFLPGPFLAAGTDPSLIPVINAVTGSTISTAAGSTPAPGVVDTAIHNLIGVEASGIGNHEWDLGSNVYLSSIAPGGGFVGANYASISANLVLAPAGFTADPLSGRFTQTVGTGVLANEEAQDLKGRIAPSAVINEGGQTIGLVGVTTQILESISSPTGAEILGFPFGPGANGETNNMALLAAQLQPVIDDLIAQGVNKIVLLSHLQQITFEQQLAPLLRGVDIILAAGSNTRLGDADDVAVSFPGHAADFANTYPIVTAGIDGKTTVIVNTDNEYTYLGRLVVDFDEAGEIIVSSLTDNVAINGAYASTAANVAAAWNDLDGDLSNSAFAAGTRGSNVKALTDAVNTVITLKDGNVYGYSNVYLEGERIQVRNQETNLGNVSADANADVARDALGLTNEHAIVSIKNGGGIRAQIGTIVNNADGTVTKVAPQVGGEVSQLDVENALRFDNKLMVFDTTAQGLLNILNSPNALAPNNGGFIQIGGVRFSYDPTRAAGSRVRDVVLVNENDDITAVIADDGVVVAGAPAVITAIALNFTANGGDGYLVKANATNFRYVLNNGTVSAAVSSALDFTAPANVPANAIGEQQAFADYFAERYATPGTAYNTADTVQALDTRIQNQAARTDTVLVGDYLLADAATSFAENGTATAFQGVSTGLTGTISYALTGADASQFAISSTGAVTFVAAPNFETPTDAGTNNVYDVRVVASNGTNTAEQDVAITVTDAVDTLTGSALRDTLTGTSGADIILGLASNDTLNGLGGNDTLDGGTGNDIVNGGLGDDTYIVDSISDKSVELADQGTDTVLTAIASYKLGDHVENLTFTYAGTSGGRAIGNAIANVLTGAAGADSLLGYEGNDTLYGLDGIDNLNGGIGNDLLDGGTGADTLIGGLGDDVFIVDDLGDIVREGVDAGTDRVESSVTFTALANVENLTLTGTAAINGTTGRLANVLTGNSGDNVLFGAGGADTLLGMGGNDTLNGGTGQDTLTGGLGADTFLFASTSTASLGSTVDLVADFSRTEGDKLAFSKAIFTGLGAVGTLSEAEFQIGTAALDATDRVIYDQVTGNLYYDADGIGRRAQVLVATIGAETHATLAFDDFMIMV